jgi:hypothetical protein
MGWSIIRRTSLGLLLAALVSGCGKEVEVADVRNCFPEAARRWIHVEEPSSDAAPAPAQPTATATVYVDRSGSMSGYLAGAEQEARPLHDLIGNLPFMLGRQGARAQYKAFGTHISPILSPAQREALMEPGYYSCAGRRGEDCDNNRTKLDLVFDEIAAHPAEMAVVVTDLWFDDPRTQTSALSALAEPLTRILASERAIAIYGIAAPFDGNIYMPAPTPPTRFRGRHPLYVIVAGSDAQVAAFHEAWRHAPGPYLRVELQANRIRRTVFTLRPALASAAPAEPLQGNADPRVDETAVMEAFAGEAAEGLRLQQFLIDGGQSLRELRPVPAMAAWRGPEASAFVPDSVWQGSYETRLHVWRRRGSACSAEDWEEESYELNPLWSGEGEGQRQFSLNPETLAGELGTDGTFLIVPELVRRTLHSPNPASDWLRQWSFTLRTPNPQRLDAGGVPFFPTLYAEEVPGLLEDALAEAARRRPPPPIFGFAFVIRVRD